MLRALLERGIAPDLVVGTSIGAINGAAVACGPEASPRSSGCGEGVVGDRAQATCSAARSSAASVTLARTRTHLHDPVAAARPAGPHPLPVARGSRTSPVPFECVAASIEGAAEHWFGEAPWWMRCWRPGGPGHPPARRVGGEHFIDGGVVNRYPGRSGGRARRRPVYVLQVGRVERPLEPPRWPWEVALVAFESRAGTATSPTWNCSADDVALHVLPTGQEEPPSLQRPLPSDTATATRRRTGATGSPAPTAPR